MLRKLTLTLSLVSLTITSAIILDRRQYASKQTASLTLTPALNTTDFSLSPAPNNSTSLSNNSSPDSGHVQCNGVHFGGRYDTRIVQSCVEAVSHIYDDRTPQRFEIRGAGASGVPVPQRVLSSKSGRCMINVMHPFEKIFVFEVVKEIFG